ncbi:MAG: hypothetical protein ACRC1K_00110 [Planctomycetia bacterium]
MREIQEESCPNRPAGIQADGLHRAGPAPSAVRRSPFGNQRHKRTPVVEAGKAKRATLDACLRKLLMIADGVLKSRPPFDPARGSKIVA